MKKIVAIIAVAAVTLGLGGASWASATSSNKIAKAEQNLYLAAANTAQEMKNNVDPTVTVAINMDCAGT